MKLSLRFLTALMMASAFFTLGRAQPSSADAGVITAVTAADDERMAATKAGDRARLEAIFSNELRYSHSSGKVDTKTSLVESLSSRHTVYESFEYKERTFSPVAPGVVLMSGRVLIHARNGDQKAELDLNFLAVWREENGHWLFRAWQSCKVPPANPPPAAK